MIQSESEETIVMDELKKKLRILRTACDEDSDDVVTYSVRKVIRIFREPEEVDMEEKIRWRRYNHRQKFLCKAWSISIGKIIYLQQGR